MSADRLVDQVGKPGGPLADASVWSLEVVTVESLTPSMRRVVLTAPGLGDLRSTPGQDLMLRVPQPGEREVNRRYTIRRLDREHAAVTLDVSLHGTGPGTEWIRAAVPGARIDAIGPRGKISLRPEADWHLFVADDTGLPGVLAMLEALPAGAGATAVLEVDSPEDNQEPATVAGSYRLHWLHRSGRALPGDAGPLVDAVGGVDLPSGTGHVYVAAELRVVRGLQEALLARGLLRDQISSKAYWVRGLPNAPHGEPAPEG